MYIECVVKILLEVPASKCLPSLFHQEEFDDITSDGIKASVPKTKLGLDLLEISRGPLISASALL